LQQLQQWQSCPDCCRKLPPCSFRHKYTELPILYLFMTSLCIYCWCCCRLQEQY
jgi:hypothetical protein